MSLKKIPPLKPAQNRVESGDAYSLYDEDTESFEIGTAGIARKMQYQPNGGWRVTGLVNKLTGRAWLAADDAANSDLVAEFDGQPLLSNAPDFVLQGYATQRNKDGSLELRVTLARGALIAHLHYCAYPQTSVIEQWAVLENTGTEPIAKLTGVDSLSVALRPSPDPLTLHWVTGVAQLPHFRLRASELTDGKSERILSTARSSEECVGWYALAEPRLGEGIFGGVEWSGTWRVLARRDAARDATYVTGGLEVLNRDLAPGERIQSARRFMGFYGGNLDDAANETHNFARRYLLRPSPDDFPWTQYNPWFWYFINVNEETMKREADVAAELGLELFYVDAGWYEGSPTSGDFSFGLGSWRENRDKFPNGIAALADYVHSKGMKFGLWVEPERIDLKYVGAGKEVPFEWLAPGVDPNAPPPPDLPSSAQICLGNPRARAWMKQMLARLIRDYKLDWLKWDNNIYMWCGVPGHEGDGNHAHVEGLYEVLDHIRQEFPHVMFENCASGGHRMDYGLLRRTDVQWMHDNTEPSYRVRYYFTGTSYAFPPEYLNSWIVGSYFEDIGAGLNDDARLSAWLRSRMLGAFGISLGISGFTPEQRARVAALIAEYKSIRPLIAKGKLYHLTPQFEVTEPNLQPPAEPDAVQYYDPETQEGVVFLFQGTNNWGTRAFQLKRLKPETLYQISARDGSMAAQMRGQDLMAQGIRINYDAERPSRLLMLKPAT